MKATAGQKITVEKPTEEKLKQLNVKNWPTWTKEASTFDWHYDDKETCYILEGEVTVKTNDASVSFKAGYLVTFPKGLSCQWQIHKPVKKHYHFG